MTGILPIIRYGTQSALSDFREYTFLRPHAYAPYVGFTQSDVEQLAARNSMDMDELERWYDGYELHFLDRTAKEHRTLRCYAPFSVMSACENGEVGPYWTSTEAFSSLLLYIDIDFKGLQRSIVKAVAAAVARAHEKGCAYAFYNNEQALRAVVKAAYISAADHYAKVEELPSGRGVADVVYLPKRGDAAPALVVELKWDRKPEAAIAQIRKKDYPAVLRDWGGPTLLVGISYESKTRTHSCTIEEA